MFCSTSCYCGKNNLFSKLTDIKIGYISLFKLAKGFALSMYKSLKKLGRRGIIVFETKYYKYVIIKKKE